MFDHGYIDALKCFYIYSQMTTRCISTLCLVVSVRVVPNASLHTAHPHPVFSCLLYVSSYIPTKPYTWVVHAIMTVIPLYIY